MTTEYSGTTKRKKKMCTRCTKYRAVSRFHMDRNRRDGLYPWCKPCRQAYAQGMPPDWLKESRSCRMCSAEFVGPSNKIYCGRPCSLKAGRVRAYGLTLDDYDRLINYASGLCPICNRETRKWNIEHNHETGLVTGVTCSDCNTLLLRGARHDVEVAKRLVTYLTRTPAEELGITAIADAPSVNRKGRTWKWSDAEE